ncbi:MAG TPA: cupredoxin domain-containing protein [Rhizomicrobium sp.]|nr:cupredoxin domain-containing protein [Rhizomicrobium sp.]
MKPILFALAAVLAATSAQAADEPIALRLKDHKFTPAEIHVKAGQPNLIVMTNEDATAEEFDSSALKVEKVVAGNSSGNVRLRPLAPGRYPFTGEFHAETAQGVVIAE